MLNIGALAWSILDSDMIILGDEQLLSRQVFVFLPDLERLTVCSEVRSKVDTEIGIGEIAGRETDGGAGTPIAARGKIRPSEKH